MFQRIKSFLSGMHKEEYENDSRELGGQTMKIIVGLGNPGSNYNGTKHNVGFCVIDKLAKDYNINMSKLKHKAFIGEGMIKGQKALLVKPQTYMNLSGESVGEIMRFYKYNIQDLLVIYDDTSLPLGATRLREKGSAGGHNGMKSIINHLNTDAFLRLKVGIGEKPSGWDLADYVLSHFTKDEEPLILSGIDRAEKAAEVLMEHGVQEAMNQTNQKVR